ncbi:MAG: stage III sporulation protein AE [Oscillospiraceae bacterium]|nr:stage III sporulation protein AE [Oscillospiraceae bacterium]
MTALLLCLALLALAAPCRAVNIVGETGADALPGALPEGAREALDGMEVTDAELEVGLERIGSYLANRFQDVLSEILRPFGAVLAVAVLCALGETLSHTLLTGGQGGFDFAGFGGALAVSAVTLSDVRSVVSMGAETLDQLWEFTRVLLPVLTAASVSAGAVTSAAAKSAAATLFADILLTAARTLILPLVCAYAATEAAGAALGTKQLVGVSRLLQWGAKTLMKGLALAFTAYLTLTGVSAESADAALVRTAKAALSAALPVVGKTLSDASESLVAGAALVRNAAGIFGLLALLAVVAMPVLRLLLRWLLFQAAAAVASAIAGERLGGLIAGIGNAYAMVLGLVGVGAAIFFLAVVSFLRTVSG